MLKGQSEMTANRKKQCLIVVACVDGGKLRLKLLCSFPFNRELSILERLYNTTEHAFFAFSQCRKLIYSPSFSSFYDWPREIIFLNRKSLLLTKTAQNLISRLEAHQRDHSHVAVPASFAPDAILKHLCVKG